MHKWNQNKLTAYVLLYITYSDKTFSFKELLEKDNSASVQKSKRCATIATAMYKASNGISPDITNVMF